MKLHYHPKFIKQYKKLPQVIKSLLQKKGEVFLSNPFDSRLKTHKLHGKLENFYSFSINYGYRVVFEFIDNNAVKFLEVGTHEIYR